MALQSREEAVRFLADVPSEKGFWCHDGRTLRNMGELAKALSGMPEETFIYHANREKNDFVTWVRDVIGDMKLAAALQLAPDREKAADGTTRRVGVLTRRLSPRSKRG
jgi:hypothetical protein